MIPLTKIQSSLNVAKDTYCWCRLQSSVHTSITARSWNTLNTASDYSENPISAPTHNTRVALNTNCFTDRCIYIAKAKLISGLRSGALLSPTGRIHARLCPVSDSLSSGRPGPVSSQAQGSENKIGKTPLHTCGFGNKFLDLTCYLFWRVILLRLSLKNKK